MSSPFAQLPAAALDAVADAFECGRISSGNALALRTYVPEGQCAEIGAEIDRLINSGAHGDHIAYLLRALSFERKRTQEQIDAVELVWSGPDGSGGEARETGVVVRELFASAKKSVIVVGFAIAQGKDIFHVLADRMDTNLNLDVTMFINVARGYRDTTIDSQLARRFAADFKRNQWPGKRLPIVYYDPRSLSTEEHHRSSLHAKCIVADDYRVFITSANFTEAAQERNVEVGVLIKSRVFATRTANQLLALIQAGSVQLLAM